MKYVTITDAFKDIVTKFGHNILLCPQAYDLLLKSGVFEYYPISYKNIIKFIFDEGMIESINSDFYLTIYPSKDYLIENLVDNYGYDSHLIKEIVECIWDSILSIPRKDSFKCLQIIYDDIIDNRGKLVRTPENDGWYLITKKGKVLRYFCDEVFIISDNFLNGYVCASSDNKWGIIDINANYITPLEYESKSECEEIIKNLPPIDFERVLDDCLLEPIQLQDEYGRNYYGLKNIETQEIHHFFKAFRQPFTLHYGLKTVFTTKNGVGVEGWAKRYGFINKREQFVINPIFKSAEDFEIGPIARVMADNGRYGKINIIGDYLINPEYESLFSPFYCHKSLMPAQRNKKKGFIDDRGKSVIDFQFKDVYSFKNGFAPVKDFDNKWGYIDIEGNVRIPFNYDEVNYFEKLQSGRIVALVKQKGRYLFIDKKGKALTKRYIRATEFEYGYAVVSKIVNYSEKWGIINENEETIFPFIIDEINPCGFMESDEKITLDVLIGSAYLTLDMNSLRLSLSKEWDK